MTHSLITGGQGFIGSRLAMRLLQRGDRVTVVDRVARDERLGGLRLFRLLGEVEVIEADLRSEGAASAALAGAEASGGPVDSVFHLAAQTEVGEAMREPTETFEANVEATWRLLEACRGSAATALIVASSDKAYGPPVELPYREDHPLRPASPYEASKAASEVLALSHARCYGMPLAVTRLANVYGGGDRTFSRLVPEAACAALQKREPAIRSDGTPERDFLHVSDAVEAYVALEEALRSGRGAARAYNAGTGRPTAVGEVLQEVGKVAREGLQWSPGSAPSEGGEIDRQYVDSSALEALTGWSPRIGLKEGLTEAVKWYRSRPEALIPAPLPGQVTEGPFPAHRP